jgi:hypothetical protein
METGAWKQVFGEHGEVSFLRPGKNWHFVCFRSVEEALRAREALNGTDGSVLIGRRGLWEGIGTWLAQHGEGLRVVSEDAGEELGETIMRIDWAVPQNVRHPLFEEMRDMQDMVNPGWLEMKSRSASSKSRKVRAQEYRSNRRARVNENTNTMVSTRPKTVRPQSLSSGSFHGNILEQLLMSSEVPTCPPPPPTAHDTADGDVHEFTSPEEFDGTGSTDDDALAALSCDKPTASRSASTEETEKSSQKEAIWKAGLVTRRDLEIPVLQLTAAQRKNQKRFLLKKMRKINRIKTTLSNGSVLQRPYFKQKHLLAQEGMYLRKLDEHKRMENDENIGGCGTAVPRAGNDITVAGIMHRTNETRRGQRREFSTAITQSGGNLCLSMMHTAAPSESGLTELRKKEAAVTRSIRAKDPELALKFLNELVTFPPTEPSRAGSPLGHVRGSIEMCNDLLKAFISNGQVERALDFF